MREEKRNSVVNLINNIKRQQAEYLALENHLKKLSEYPEVKEYIRIKNRISALGHDKSIISYNYLNHFRAAIFGETCEHPIYFYIGKYQKKENYWDCEQAVLSKDDPKYTCNIYRCLECEERITISKELCQEFEEKHPVIVISRDDHNINANEFRKYNNNYYQLLLEGTTEEAVEEIKKLVKRKW